MNFNRSQIRTATVCLSLPPQVIQLNKSPRVADPGRYRSGSDPRNNSDSDHDPPLKKLPVSGSTFLPFAFQSQSDYMISYYNSS